MKFISWNIDSINAALTGTSKRAGETRQVLHTIADQDPDAIAIQETKLSKDGPTKKHLQVLADLFPDYTVVWRSSVEPALQEAISASDYPAADWGAGADGRRGTNHYPGIPRVLPD